MKNKIFFMLIFALLFLTACAGPGPAVEVSQSVVAATLATYTDPFAYCAAVGTLDAPDARYTGQAISDEVMNGYLKAAGLDPSIPVDPNFRKMTVWRCMGGKLQVCNFGANLPCTSKANTDKTPTQAMQDFCKENKNSDFIPMVVTGHETVYSWHCVQDQPTLLEQISPVDAAGFKADIWYALEALK